MPRLADIESPIVSMSALSDIVGAMRALPSMRIQEAHPALPGVRRYAEAMATAIADALLCCPSQQKAHTGQVAAPSFCASPSTGSSAALTSA